MPNHQSEYSTELAVELNRLSHDVIGAALEVHRVLGPGFLESVYEEALCLELELRGIPFARQAPLPVWYKGRIVGEGRMDLLVGGCLVIELKAVEVLAQIHAVQLLTYLRATGHKLGLLINFNVAVLKHGIKRVVLSHPHEQNNP
ncbi:MAG TPA: GxxExxY protein [Chloroflexia bacterium]|nr:GxxExxY protein [Chloroflexia bacterium]